MSSKSDIKQNLHNACFQFIENRLLTIQKSINEIQESLTSETKSSAGDKHETGRAMLQLEREKSGNQLAEIMKVKEAFSKIDISKSLSTIGLGSLVFTNQSNYFIAISAGEITVNKQQFFCVSPNTPIGKLVIGKQINDVVKFREQEFKISAIF
ncbi:3-oxoacyl-ACP synthase [Xanthomarina sp. GH4-25]|uniref:3-oxoacyl-ACP synthase n=1 Tax=Xanthomarina sp. GH4-25 TaxID=3349335 RepID=UPI0038782BC0